MCSCLTVCLLSALFNQNNILLYANNNEETRFSRNSEANASEFLGQLKESIIEYVKVRILETRHQKYKLFLHAGSTKS